MKKIIEKMKKRKLTKECWNLDNELVKWINIHMRRYLIDASSVIDLEFHKFTYKKKELTQLQIITRIIEITDELLEDESPLYIGTKKRAKHLIDIKNEMYDLLKMVHYTMWW